MAVLAAYLLGTFPSAARRRPAVGLRPDGGGVAEPRGDERLPPRGRRAGAVVLALDLAKGAIAAGAGWAVGGHTRRGRLRRRRRARPLPPVTRGFRGGKGVATAAGAAIVLEPLVSLAVGVLFVAVLASGRRASVASVVAAVALPAGVAVAGRPAGEVALWVGVAVLVVVRHRSNLARLVAGTEPALPDRDA